MNQIQTRTRVENPARWMKAAERAESEGVRVCQMQGSGQWVATSGTASGTAYEVQVTGNVAHGCDCLAGMNGDAVCKHRAAFYLLIGALDLTPEPDPPALGVAPGAATPARPCFWCYGSGRVPNDDDRQYAACRACAGIGTVPASRPPERERIAA